MRTSRLHLPQPRWMFFLDNHSFRSKSRIYGFSYFLTEKKFKVFFCTCQEHWQKRYCRMLQQTSVIHSFKDHKQNWKNNLVSEIFFLLENFLWTRRMQLRQLCWIFTARNLVFFCWILKKNKHRSSREKFFFKMFLWIRWKHILQSWPKFVDDVWKCLTRNPKFKLWFLLQKFQFFSTRSCGQVDSTCHNPAGSFLLDNRLFRSKSKNYDFS